MKRLITGIVAMAFCMALAQGPAPEMKKLDVMNGSWEGKAKNYMEPGADPQVTDVSMEVDFVLGGMFQRIRYFSEIPGMGKLEGLIMTGWDETKKAYRSHNYNNYIAVPVEELGKWEGEVLVGKTAPLESFGGMVQHSRMTVKGKDVLTLRIEAETGGTRTVMMEIEVKRKKS